MDLRARQDQFDKIKWYDSMLAGEDRCGKYDFCVKCHKEETYPCAKALNRFEKGYIRVAVVNRR